MAAVWREMPPGARQILIHTMHSVGPPGANGTQQFPKMTDPELVAILKPLIRDTINVKYCCSSNSLSDAQNVLANLRPIVECCKKIFCKVETEHGYCSCECLRALQRHQVISGKACDPVFRAVMICFTFADLQMQLACAKPTDAAKAAASTTVTRVQKRKYPVDLVDPHNKVFHQHSQDPNTHEGHIKDLLDKLDHIHEESEWLRRIILNGGV
jgi:hypothetical protein